MKNKIFLGSILLISVGTACAMKCPDHHLIKKLKQGDQLGDWMVLNSSPIKNDRKKVRFTSAHIDLSKQMVRCFYEGSDRQGYNTVTIDVAKSGNYKGANRYWISLNNVPGFSYCTGMSIDDCPFD